MKRKLLFAIVAGTCAVVLTGCFELQSFTVLKGALAPGKSTTVRFTVHPHSAAKNPPYSTAYQFVMVGVSNTDDLAVGKATWGANGKFAGPQNMPVSASLATSIGTDCDGSGFTFADMSAVVTWKGFITLGKIADRQRVTEVATVNVALKAKAGATSADPVLVAGLTGAWIDDGNGIMGSEDNFYCTGNATTFVNIL
jgi:hypothetical protein